MPHLLMPWLFLDPRLLFFIDEALHTWGRIDDHGEYSDTIADVVEIRCHELVSIYVMWVSMKDGRELHIGFSQSEFDALNFDAIIL